MVLNLDYASESPRGVVYNMILGMAPRVSGSVGLGQGLRMCISSKFPADVDAAVPRPHCENHCLGGCHPWGSGTVGTPSWQPLGDLGDTGRTQRRAC